MKVRWGRGNLGGPSLHIMNCYELHCDDGRQTKEAQNGGAFKLRPILGANFACMEEGGKRPEQGTHRSSSSQAAIAKVLDPKSLQKEIKHTITPVLIVYISGQLLVQTLLGQARAHHPGLWVCTSHGG